MGNSGSPWSGRRVVVTGVGVVSPLGLTAAETWRNALEGKPGIHTLTHFDTTDCPVKIAGEVRGFDVTRPLGPFHPFGSEHPPLTHAANVKEARKVGRFCHLGLVAGIEAYSDSGLDAVRDKISPEQMGV